MIIGPSIWLITLTDSGNRVSDYLGDLWRSRVGKDLVTTQGTMDFTDTAQNVVFMGGPVDAKGIWPLLLPSQALLPRGCGWGFTLRSIWSTSLWRRRLT